MAADALVELELGGIFVGDGIEDEVLLFVGDFDNQGVGVFRGEIGAT